MQFAIQSSNKFLVNYSTSAAYSTTAIHALWEYYYKIWFENQFYFIFIETTLHTISHALLLFVKKYLVLERFLWQMYNFPISDSQFLP